MEQPESVWLLQNKWQVMISSRNLKRLMEIKNELGSKYGADLIDCCGADVTNEESVQKLQQATNTAQLVVL